MKSDTKVWIATHDGDLSLRDPYIRDGGLSGPGPKWAPIFLAKGEANSWCKSVGAVATPCEYGRAVRAIEAAGAKAEGGAS